jgi:hypothetical protein
MRPKLATGNSFNGFHFSFPQFQKLLRLHCLDPALDGGVDEEVVEGAGHLWQPPQPRFFLSRGSRLYILCAGPNHCNNPGYSAPS